MKSVVGARLVAVSLMILIVFMVSPVLVRALDYNVGVKVGDWIKYGQVTVAWNGNGTEPSYITDQKKEDWYRMDVENVSGTTVTLNETIHYNNGTQTSHSSSVDVKGTETVPFGIFLIASNLTEGDPVTNQTSLLTINQTTTGIYAGANRNVNLVEITSVIRNQMATAKIYWDQSTGAMVDWYEKIPDLSDPGAYVEFSFKATETNMWNADFVEILYNYIFYSILGAAVILLLFILAAGIFLRRREPPLSQQPPPPSAPPHPPPS